MRDYVHQHTVGDLLTNSATIYRQHFRSFAVAYLIPALPLTLLQEELQRTRNFAVLLPVLILSFVVVGVAGGAMTIMVSDACLGRTVSARRAYRSLLAGRAWKVMGTSLLVLLVLVASVLLLILPVVVVYPSMMLAIPAAVLEGKRPGAAVKRSWALSRGLRWRNLGVVALIFLVFAGAAMVVTVPAAIAVGVATSGDEAEFERWMSIISAILQTLVVPFALVLQVLLYYDARVRHEGYDSAALSSDLHM